MDPAEERLRELLHEVRTPLAALAAMAPLLEEPLRETYLGVLDHLAELLKRSTSSGPPTATGTGFPLQDVIAETVGLLRVSDPGLAVEVDGDAVTERVRGDRVSVTQILLNLIGNAARHSPQGAPVTLTLGRDDGHVVVEVRDRGPGIGEDLAEQVFERGVSRGEHCGDGLGLPLARRLAEAMGGRLELGPQHGGAVLRLLLPVA